MWTSVNMKSNPVTSPCSRCVFRVPKGLEDVSKYPKLLEELLRRGYSEEDVSKVVGKNLIAAMEKMEKVTLVHFCLRSLLRAFK